MIMDAFEIQKELNQFCGTQAYHRLSPFFRKVVGTDGVVEMAKLCKANWLVSDIAMLISMNLKDNEEAKYFQSWKLTVKDNQATLVCEDGNGGILYQSEDHTNFYTDFPLEEITLWVEPTYMEGEGNLFVVMLPNER